MTDKEQNRRLHVVYIGENERYVYCVDKHNLNHANETQEYE